MPSQQRHDLGRAPSPLETYELENPPVRDFPSLRDDQGHSTWDIPARPAAHDV
ncbi:hypothetical protein ACFYNY_32975 [Streptomyces sp. NPDC006530]|uniref:hypothetical protein n=1 Tax=Streptomyces sp. NPDC006530 TaxID=3364750 RepID=UPI003695E054